MINFNVKTENYHNSNYKYDSIVKKKNAGLFVFNTTRYGNFTTIAFVLSGGKIGCVRSQAYSFRGNRNKLEYFWYPRVLNSYWMSASDKVLCKKLNEDTLLSYKTYCATLSTVIKFTNSPSHIAW